MIVCILKNVHLECGKSRKISLMRAILVAAGRDCQNAVSPLLFTPFSPRFPFLPSRGKTSAIKRSRIHRDLVFSVPIFRIVLIIDKINDPFFLCLSDTSLASSFGFYTLFSLPPPLHFRLSELLPLLPHRQDIISENTATSICAFPPFLLHFLPSQPDIFLPSYTPSRF